MGNSRELLRTREEQQSVSNKLGRLRGISEELDKIEPRRLALIMERTLFIASAWAAGATQSEIAQAAGITNARVSQLITQHTRRVQQ